jgi:hypothetical protein
VDEAPKKTPEPELIEAEEVDDARPRTRVAQELTREPPRALAQAPTTGVGTRPPRASHRSSRSRSWTAS